MVVALEAMANRTHMVDHHMVVAIALQAMVDRAMVALPADMDQAVTDRAEAVMVTKPPHTLNTHNLQNINKILVKFKIPEHQFTYTIHTLM